MISKELIDILSKNPQFKVVISVTDNNVAHWPSFERFNIVGLCDIGHSDGVIILDAEKETP